MGKPAARMGDLAGHGGTIIFGSPTVIIGGQFAARVGDPLICPGFDGPKPHIMGNIILGSLSVIIDGGFAARVGDMTGCGIAGVSGKGLPAVKGGPVNAPGEVSKHFKGAELETGSDDKIIFVKADSESKNYFNGSDIHMKHEHKLVAVHYKSDHTEVELDKVYTKWESQHGYDPDANTFGDHFGFGGGATVINATLRKSAKFGDGQKVDAAVDVQAGGLELEVGGGAVLDLTTDVINLSFDLDVEVILGIGISLKWGIPTKKLQEYADHPLTILPRFGKDVAGVIWDELTAPIIQVPEFKDSMKQIISDNMSTPPSVTGIGVPMTPGAIAMGCPTVLIG